MNSSTSTNSNILTNYLFHGILGAIIFMLMYHLVINKYSTITALIPAFPLVGMYGLYLIYINNGNIKNYLTKISVFVTTALIFYITMLMIYIKTKNLLYGLTVGIVIWLISCCLNLNYN